MLNENTEESAFQDVLEKDKRLSDSIIWTWQANAFKNYAIDAWRRNIVPNYITSNAFISKRYATMVLDHLRDVVYFNKIQEPIYIVELGAGAGQFSALFMHHFYPMLAKTHFSDLKVIYVITDCVKTTIDYCRQHPSLQPHIESGHCDFAVFDVETDDAFHLSVANKVLNETTLRTPLIVIANYFFDVIKHDLFYISHEQLFESLVTLRIKPLRKRNIEEKLALNKVDLIYKNNLLRMPYYTNDKLNKLLHYYKNTISDSYVLFPCTGLKCIELLYKISAGRLLFLNADKGFYKLENIPRKKPVLSTHGDCFSVSVNYHALGYYVKELGGLALQHKSGPLTLNAFLFADNVNEHVEIRRSFTENIVNFGPNEFFQIKKSFERHVKIFSLPEIESYLQLSVYDSKILYLLLPRLAEALPRQNEAIQQRWLAIVRYTWSNHYMHVKHTHLAYAIGDLMQKLEQWDEALTYYQYSLHHEIDNARLRFNIAFCYWKKEDTTVAVRWAKESLEQDPGLVEAAQLLKTLQ